MAANAASSGGSCWLVGVLAVVVGAMIAAVGTLLGHGGQMIVYHVAARPPRAAPARSPEAARASEQPVRAAARDQSTSASAGASAAPSTAAQPTPRPRAAPTARLAASRAAAGACTTLGERVRALAGVPETASVRGAEARADVADSALFQAFLQRTQLPPSCAPGSEAFEYRSWANGLGSQLNVLVRSWGTVVASALQRGGAAAAEGAPPPPVPPLVLAGREPYVNAELCERRTVECYVERFSTCAAGADGLRTRALKPQRGLAKSLPAAAGRALGSPSLASRPRSWYRRELSRFLLRPNARLRALVRRFRDESGLSAALANASGAARGPRPCRVLGVHVRRGDKADRGARQRAEPFPDAMYAAALAALARETSAAIVLLASDDERARRGLEKALHAAGAPAARVLEVPRAHFLRARGAVAMASVVRHRRPEGQEDEGLSLLALVLFLAEASDAGFVGTMSANLSELIAVMQGVFHAYPVSFDLSCHGLNEFHGLRGANTSTRPEHVFGGGSMWPMPRMAEVHPACARVLHLARAAGKKSSLRRRRRSSASSLAPSTRRSH